MTGSVHGRRIMAWDRVEGNWKQVKGKVKEQWGKLTDDDLDVINGRRDQLEGKIQERYGHAKDQVQRDIDGDGVALAEEQLADAAQQIDIVGAVIAPPAGA